MRKMKNKKDWSEAGSYASEDEENNPFEIQDVLNDINITEEVLADTTPEIEDIFHDINVTSGSEIAATASMEVEDFLY